ncbi:MAG: hypothetical protein OES24_00875 [Acidimicrobiia bacterium]|nr:hypothetical protein [Acidimicrobiia bacterium]
MEMGNVGSDQLAHGRDGLDGLAGLDAITGEVPTQPRARASVLAEDGRRSTRDPAGTISINLETNDVPFQQPNPRTVPAEPPGHDWRAAVVDAGRWPIVALGVAAVLAAVFAAFISRNGQSLSGDADSAAAPAAVESTSGAAPATDAVAAGAAQAEIDPDPLAATGEPDGSSGRSTGGLGPAEGSGFFTGQIVEPDRSLTESNVDWVPTTTTPPTTATTVTTPSTEVPSSTEPSSTTTDSSATTVVPDEIKVRALGPGTADESSPAVVSGGRVTLEAEGSDNGLRYRFVVSVRDDDGDWRQVDRSGWRSRSSWTVRTREFRGRTVRWTVTAVDRSGERTAESTPLYFRVGGDDD